MPKLYHRNTGEVPQSKSIDDLLRAIETFLSTCRNPAVLEYGDDLLVLHPGEYTLELRAGRLWLEAWNESRSLTRRILSLEGAKTGALDCTVQRFGNKPGKLSFLDLDRPQIAHRSLSGARQSFAEQFRRMLFRQFPGWDISALSSSIDLQRSFSALFPRARLTRGNQQIAAMACPARSDEASMLTFAIAWYEHVRIHSPTGVQTSLCLFLPEHAGNLTAHRLAWLTGESLACRMFRFNPHGFAGEVDPQDLGNLETRVKAASTAPENRHGPFVQSGSERWLEVAIRSNIGRIDPTLLPDPIYEQTLAFAAGDRDMIDLLAVSPSGRLAVLELKVSEDLHLPIQALDYWMRIHWHASRGELTHLFPSVTLAAAPPKLLLVAPAMSFHPSNTAILRHFSPEIEVERVGVNTDWERHLKVVLRLSGSDMPISHRNFS